MKTILLKLSGPLQSWGTNSHFETRHTDYYPSKSAIIGLVSASLGYKRYEDQKIQALNQLDFAVRIDQQGLLLQDFHIAEKLKNNGTSDRRYLTYRYYLEDAIFTVGLGSQDNQLINSIDRALKNPYYQPFMGRRSLPLPADFYLGISETNVIETLKELPWQARSWYKKKHTNKLTIYTDVITAECLPKHMRKDRVLSFSQKERKFGYRSESRMEIIVPNDTSTTEHDVFGMLGD